MEDPELRPEEVSHAVEAALRLPLGDKKRKTRGSESVLMLDADADAR